MTKIASTVFLFVKYLPTMAEKCRNV